MEGATQGGQAQGPDALGERRVGCERLGRVVGAGVDMQLARHAVSHEALREVDVLVAKEVDRADIDEGGRQAGEISGS